MVTPITAISQPNTPIDQASGAGSIQSITQAIKQASARTGVDFSYLLNKASQESNFDPNAKSSTSSATGLFQFTSQTWLQMVKDHGSQYGLGQYASHITTDANGVEHVSDPNWKHAILSLRKDPTISAEMAGALDKENYTTLANDVGGKIGPTELYLAHFLGAGGAGDFIDAMRTNPNAKAASILPGAAEANPTVFYDKSGTPRSLKQIYQQFAQKFDNAPDIPISSGTMFADAAPIPSSQTDLGAAANTLAQARSYSASVMSQGVQSSNSSLYTTMVIAQMDLHGNGLASLGTNNGSDHKHNSTSFDSTSIV